MLQNSYKESKYLRQKDNISSKVKRNITIVYLSIAPFLYENKEDWLEAHCFYSSAVTQPQKLLFCSYLKFQLCSLFVMCPISKFFLCKVFSFMYLVVICAKKTSRYCNLVTWKIVCVFFFLFFQLSAKHLSVWISRRSLWETDLNWFRAL